MSALVESPAPEPIRLVSISKRYAGTSALDNVSIAIAAGTVHALVGANGAGKSTLGKIIGGVVRADEGEMFVDGQPVRYSTPTDARRDGIATIAQELSLVPAMSVMENVFMGIEPRRRGFVLWREMRRRYAELIERSGFELKPDVTVGSLRAADQQKAEILRAVNTDARVIVLDEPTSSLTAVETEQLHTLIRGLRANGTTIVYVSHFLDEVLDLCDVVTVMRNGHVVRTAMARHETEASLVSGMFGAAASAEKLDTSRPIHGDMMLEVVGLSRADVLADISLSVRAGEILGIAGLVGSGRSELARAIAGADPIDTGTISVGGQRQRIKSPADAIDAGIAFLTEERKKDGLFMDLSLAANTTFANLDAVSTRNVLRRGDERERSRELLARVGVDPPAPSAHAKSLSGGNQQKLVFARWLFCQPRVLILDEPTRGVDVGARAAIHLLIHGLAAQGAAILLISSEIEEVLGLAHRTIVMRRGAVVSEFRADPPLNDVMEAAFGLPGSER
jgi:simple sugar transport system ATP-binding protein/ribose transport system ATP-binding protein